MRKLKIKKTFESVNPTNNYFEFVSNITEKINEDYPFTFLDDSNTVLETIDSRSSLSHSVKTRYNSLVNDSFKLVFHPHGKGINIHILQVSYQLQGQGLGRILMNKILRISNHLNIPVYLIPVQIGQTPIDVLRKFYHSFGFKRESTSRYWKYSPVKVVTLEQTNEQYRVAA